MIVRCNNCEWEGEDTSEGFTPFGKCCDLYERLVPGEEIPAGDCPECRCFCYLEPKPLYVVCEIFGGVLTNSHVSTADIKVFTMDHDNINDGDEHGIPDAVLRACGMDPRHYLPDND
jgi:hypothetical protein